MAKNGNLGKRILPKKRGFLFIFYKKSNYTGIIMSKIEKIQKKY